MTRRGGGIMTGHSADELSLRLRAVEERLAALERATEDGRRRHVLAELRHDPSRLLARIPDVRRIVPERLDELIDVLSRWDVPLSDREVAGLQHAGLVAQAISTHGGAKVHLVVEVVSSATVKDLELAARGARMFSARNRRAIPVVLTLERPPHRVVTAATELGVELVVDD